MRRTSNLGLPYIMPGQAQKHVTHNEALRRLDALCCLAVESRRLREPPAAPGEGERWIVARGATGAWSGWDGDIASLSDGIWVRIAPPRGCLAWVEDEAVLMVRAGGSPGGWRVLCAAPDWDAAGLA